MIAKEWTGTVADGKYVIPDTPIDLPEGTRVRVFILSSNHDETNLPEPIILDCKSQDPQRETRTET